MTATRMPRAFVDFLPFGGMGLNDTWRCPAFAAPDERSVGANCPFAPQAGLSIADLRRIGVTGPGGIQPFSFTTAGGWA